MVNLMKKYVTFSEQETEKLAFDLAKNLNNNSIVVLTGNLGTGKTRFMRGLAEYFGIQNEVSSPTFIIVNEYTPKANTEKVDKIFHFDVYRLSGPLDFEDSVGTDYFNSGLCIIEWGEIIKDILPHSTIYITIEFEDGIALEFQGMLDSGLFVSGLIYEIEDEYRNSFIEQRLYHDRRVV